MGSPIVPALRQQTNKLRQPPSLSWPRSLWTSTPATFPSRRRPDSGETMSALKGNADLCAAPEARVRTFYPSITETIPANHAELRNEFGKLETLMWRQTKGKTAPTPTLPDANDRIHTLGYNYCPVHTEIYGSYRSQAARTVPRL